jgi:ADP-ribose pyrophosphatase YjhB (NUDIX family)
MSMVNNINYRCAVEGILVKNNKVFICKRAENCLVKPGVWNVPAGKVKFVETPDEAIKREMLEETKIDISNYFTKRICERAFEGKDAEGNSTYRLVFTYVIYVNNIEPKLDEEHSEGKWVSYDELHEYESLNKDLLENIKKALSEEIGENNDD